MSLTNMLLLPLHKYGKIKLYHVYAHNFTCVINATTWACALFIISGLESICQPGQACNFKRSLTTHGWRVEAPDWDRYWPTYLPTYLLCVERNEVLGCSWWHLIYTLYWLKVDAYVCSMYAWALLGPLVSEFWIIDILVNDGYWSLSKCADNFIPSSY
jgi:hypothetical protein